MPGKPGKKRNEAKVKSNPIYDSEPDYGLVGPDEKGVMFSILLSCIIPLLAVHLRPYFMHHALIESKPCSLVAQFLQESDIRILQRLRAWFERQHLVDRLTFLRRRAYYLCAFKEWIFSWRLVQL